MKGVRTSKSADEAIRRLKVSIPIMTQLRLDHHMRQIILAQLLFINNRYGQSIIVPQSMKVQTVPDADYGKVMDAFQGVNEDNHELVRK